MRKTLDRLFMGALVVVVIGIPAVWLVGDGLTTAARRNIGSPPRALGVQNITFASRSGTLIHGWLSRGTPGQGAVVLLHGLRGDRRDMLSRAQFLHGLEYSVLLFDFQAHGESRGERITFGELESRDVVAALQYVRHMLPGERLGVIGVSLGAAAFVLADRRPAVDAVVLESMYPTVEQAVDDRLRLHLGPVGPLFAPLLTMQLHARFGIDADRLRPIDRMGALGAPVLIMNGTGDRHTPIEEARAIFAAASGPKELWAVEGAAHVNLHTFSGVDYERRVAAFLEKYLRPMDPRSLDEGLAAPRTSE